MTAPTAKSDNAVAPWVVVAGGLLVMYGACLFAWHFIEWLRDGVWPVYLVQNLVFDAGWPWPQVQWGGVQQIINWCMGRTVVGASFWVGIALAWAGAAFNDK